MVELLVDVLAPALNNLHFLVQLPLVVREVLDVLVQLLLHLLQQQRVLLVPALQALDVVLAEPETYSLKPKILDQLLQLLLLDLSLLLLLRNKQVLHLRLQHLHLLLVLHVLLLLRKIQILVQNTDF